MRRSRTDPTPRPVTTDLPHTRRLLEEEVDAGLWTMGAQVCVVTGDHVRTVAVGDAGTGQPLTPETLFKVYCAIKPVAAVAAALLVARGALDLDRPVDELVPGYRALRSGAVTLRHVLSHTAGLHVLATAQLELLPDAQRRMLVEQAAAPDGWRVGVDASYSEFLGWHVLGLAIQRVTGQPLRAHLRESVLDPLDLASTFIGMTESEFAANAPRLGLSWQLRGERRIPMLMELSPRWCQEVNCASGGYSTATDLARFYASLAAQLGGAGRVDLPPRETLTTFCSNARPRAYDTVLQRECDYGLGFMVNLSEHFYGDTCSTAAFGHSGLAGSTFAFGEPEAGIGAAVILNGIIDGEASLLRRAAIVDAIHRDLGLD